jgi:WD40 repeat protein
MFPRTIPLGLVTVLAIGWPGVLGAQQVTFRLPDDEPCPNCDVIRSVTYSPDGSLVAVGYGRFTGLLQESRPGQAVMWDARSGKRMVRFAARDEGVCSVASSPNGKTLAAAEYMGFVRLWDTAIWEQLRAMNGAFPIAFSPAGRELVSMVDERTLAARNVAGAMRR